MQKITSILDLYEKIEKDNRYKNLIIISYHNYIVSVSNSQRLLNEITYEESMNWIVKWAEENEQLFKASGHDNQLDFSCTYMAEFINESLSDALSCKDELWKK